MHAFTVLGAFWSILSIRAYRGCGEQIKLFQYPMQFGKRMHNCDVATLTSKFVLFLWEFEKELNWCLLITEHCYRPDLTTRYGNHPGPWLGRVLGSLSSEYVRRIQGRHIWRRDQQLLHLYFGKSIIFFNFWMF